MKYIGKKVKIKGKGNVFDGVVEGIVLPNENKDIYVLKLKSGYNIVVKKENVKSIEIISDKNKSKKEILDLDIKQNKNLPKVAIISMGGTIASKVDYETGGVSAQFKASDLLLAIPEIKELAFIDTFALSNILSENINQTHWFLLLDKIKEYVEKGFEGIIVAHGTDTLHYSSSVMSFLLEKIGIPVVFVGAQRSSDRPSSDAAYNLIGALKFIIDSKKAGVFIGMHDNLNDNKIVINLGVRVRKLHSSRRDAFRPINYKPIAIVDLELKGGEITSAKTEFKKYYDLLESKEIKKIKIFKKLSDKVGLIKYFPTLKPEIFKQFTDNFDIVIIEGTGLGHVSTIFLDVIRNSKSMFFMTTQTIFGRVNMDVYTTGRELQEAGVIGLEDMFPEVAFVKAKYVLAKIGDLDKEHKDKIKELMLKNLKGELKDKTLIDEFY